MEQLINWGIVGPGRIARELAEEWNLIHGARLAGVASRSRERGEAFARDFGVERVYEDYDAMFADPAIDIVYIAVPHTFHRELTLRAMKAGKAVFCEKPMGINAGEVEELAEAARVQGIFLMEAVKTRFMPAVGKALEWIAEDRIGQPTFLQACFVIDAGGDETSRHWNPDLAGGALLDLGVYPLTLAELFLGLDPIETQATATLAPTGVDATTLINLRYAGGAVAQLAVSLGQQAGNGARLWGPKGCLDFPACNQPQSVSLHLGDEVVSFSQDDVSTFRYEVEEANRCLREGLLESPRLTLDDSLRMARWQDDILAQIQAPRADR